MNEKSKGIRPKMKALGVDEQVIFDLNCYKYNSIRSTAFALNVEENKVFTTRLDREHRTITVTRVK